MMPVAIIRPQPGCHSSVKSAKALGLDAHGFPMFEIHPVTWAPPAAKDIDALLIGSANALRHGGAALAAFSDKPAYTVGETTAQAARTAGLNVAATGQGGLQDVLDTVPPEHRRLLRLSGVERVDLATPDGISLIERTVYSSDALPMPPALAGMLGAPCLVLLHSAQAARHFAASCDTRKIDRSRIAIAAIGPRVARAVGEGWLDVRCPETPSESALLALAQEMCQETEQSPTTIRENRQGPMQDQTGTYEIAGRPPRGRSGRGQLLVALLAFVLGAALVCWFAWRGYLDAYLPQVPKSEQAPAMQVATSAPEAAADRQDSLERSKQREIEALSSAEARLAMLEDRFSRLNLQADAASGNAARAESLLIAFATRRMVDRGQPLRYLADQLRLRFGNAQPRAVKSIIEFAEKPVTLDELTARLEALSPQLTGTKDDKSFWDGTMEELKDLFTVRREPSALLTPEARVERARVMLRAGKIPEAIDQVERTPGAGVARMWIADARRYAAVQQSLDLLETAAMLEPTRLKDSEGNRVSQPSPLATPTATPDKNSGR